MIFHLTFFVSIRLLFTIDPRPTVTVDILGDYHACQTKYFYYGPCAVTIRKGKLSMTVIKKLRFRNYTNILRIILNFIFKNYL